MSNKDKHTLYFYGILMVLCALVAANIISYRHGKYVGHDVVHVN